MSLQEKLVSEGFGRDVQIVKNSHSEEEIIRTIREYGKHHIPFVMIPDGDNYSFYTSEPYFSRDYSNELSHTANFVQH
ncbi:MAG: hypothetical protein WC438_01765 [Candidatus Pacearchaeota archaeon]